MHWEVHWQYYRSMEQKSYGEAGLESYNTFRSYEAAWDRYVTMASNTDVVARCWLTVHRNEEDKDGDIMCASSMLWSDEIKIIEY